MPCSYVIDPSRRLVLTRSWGTLTDHQVLALHRAIGADSRFQTSFRQLGDARQIQKMALTYAGVNTIATVNPFSHGARRAWVVSKDVAYGLGRVYEVVRRTPDEFQVFRDFLAALTWLDLTEADLPTGEPDRIFTDGDD